MRLNVLRQQPDRDSEPASETDSRALASELRRTLEGEVRFDDSSRALYATDGSNYRQVPLGVVIPRSAEDIEAALAACRRFDAPVTDRGAGTSLCGQSCNAAVIFDFSKYLNNVLEINPSERYTVVEPGVILDDLNAQTREHGLMYGPDPSTHYCCTFGGMLGNNSCGVHSVMACRTHRIGDKSFGGGRSSDYVQQMDVVTYDGTRLKVGDTPREEIERIIAKGGRKAEIYSGLHEIVERYGDLIRERYPAIPRRVSGYNLDDLLPENDMNIARALVGTEGTCATMLRAKVTLVKSPSERVLLVIGFDDVYAAGDFVPSVLESQPIGLEGLDHELVRYMKIKGVHPQDVELMPPGKAWLLAEFGAESLDEARDLAQKCRARLEKLDSSPRSFKVMDDDQRISEVWQVRESGLAATAWVPGMEDTWPGWEDAAIAPDRLGPYLRDFRKLLEKFDYRCALYGHFGQGCIHTRIDFGLSNHEEVSRFRGFLEEASDLVVSYGGAFSAEHGDGQSKAAFLPKMYGQELMGAMRQFKRLWDPHWRMNPGKVIDPNGPTENLRLGKDYQPLTTQTHFTFRHDQHDFSRAALRCVGVGKCRRPHDGFMCPSFHATREEKDTTRGRARLLFEMLNGDEFEHAPSWRNDTVHEALDLCLGCKGCKTECPVNVDMATYKSEFLAHYYKWRLRPRSFYAMGLIDWWARLAALAPRFTNFLSKTAPMAAVVKWSAGVSPHRQLPEFARRTFSHWAAREHRSPQLPDARTVVLLPDLFNDHFYPGSLKATLAVLEQLGFSVIVPHDHIPATRPLLHYGFLSLAKRALRRTLDILRPYIRQGIPIIGLEPSTIAAYRGELTDLLPGNQDAKRLANNSYLLSEFLMDKDVSLPSSRHRAILHVHCHQKAVLHAQAVRECLGRMQIDFEEPEPGCCGMAGSFAYELNHYDLSMSVGKQRLLPSVQSAETDTLIIADGFSCRHQIHVATGRNVLHLADVIAMAMPDL